MFNLSMHKTFHHEWQGHTPHRTPWEHVLKHNENNKRKKCAEISPKETPQIKQHAPPCLLLPLIVGQHLETHRQRANAENNLNKVQNNVWECSNKQPSWKGIQIHAKRVFSGGLRGVKYGVNIVIIWLAHISAQRSSLLGWFTFLFVEWLCSCQASSSFTPIVNPFSSSSLSSVLLLLLSSSVSIVSRRGGQNRIQFHQHQHNKLVRINKQTIIGPYINEGNTIG